MARLMRIQDDDFIVHVSNRAQEAKYLFVPDDEFNELAHRILRSALLIFEIHLYAAVLMGNHFHLILRAPLLNLHLFMAYFQGNLATAVNRLRGRLDAAVFPDRFSAEPILDIESLLKMLAYVLCNPVAANLVARPEEYPGLTTYRQCIGLEEPVELPLTTLPMWEHLSASELFETYRALVDPTVTHYERERRWRVMGADRVRNVKWWKRPRRPKRGSKAVCHGASKLVRTQYANFADSCQTRYRLAMQALRRKTHDAPFPYGMVPPGCTECSRDEPHRRAPEHLRIARVRNIDGFRLAG